MSAPSTGVDCIVLLFYSRLALMKDTSMTKESKSSVALQPGCLSLRTGRKACPPIEANLSGQSSRVPSSEQGPLQQQYNLDAISQHIQGGSRVCIHSCRPLRVSRPLCWWIFT